MTLVPWRDIWFYLRDWDRRRYGRETTMAGECYEQKMESALKTHLDSELATLPYLTWISACAMHRSDLCTCFEFSILLKLSFFFFVISVLAGISLSCENQKRLSRENEVAVIEYFYNKWSNYESAWKFAARIGLVRRSKIHLTISEGKFDLPTGPGAFASAKSSRRVCFSAFPTSSRENASHLPWRFTLAIAALIAR